jgi:hypothetical protein
MLLLRPILWDRSLADLIWPVGSFEEVEVWITGGITILCLGP